MSCEYVSNFDSYLSRCTQSLINCVSIKLGRRCVAGWDGLFEAAKMSLES